MKILFYLKLMLINNVFKGTRFFNIKRKLLLHKNIFIGNNTKIVGPININYNSKLIIGDSTWIGKDFTIDGNGEVIIGSNCDIAPNVRISNGSHKIGNSNRRAGEGIILRTVIEDSCWICTNSLIINGSKVKKSSIVGAGSVVNKTIENDSFYAGNPAKLIRKLSND